MKNVYQKSRIFGFSSCLIPYPLYPLNKHCVTFMLITNNIAQKPNFLLCQSLKFSESYELILSVSLSSNNCWINNGNGKLMDFLVCWENKD